MTKLQGLAIKATAMLDTAAAAWKVAERMGVKGDGEAVAYWIREGINERAHQLEAVELIVAGQITTEEGVIR